jgi:hypothetical protein
MKTRLPLSIHYVTLYLVFHNKFRLNKGVTDRKSHYANLEPLTQERETTFRFLYSINLYLRKEETFIT